MERTLCFWKGVYFRVHNESLPPRPRQGAAPRLIVRPGWWTFGRMESEMECDIVESPSSIPRDPIARQRPNHPHTHAVRVQVPPLTWATVALAVGDSGVVVWLVSQRFQWNRAPLIAWYTDATDYLLPPQSIQQCAADPTLLQTLTLECCLTVFSFYQFMIVWHLNNGVYEHVLALRKLMLIYPDGLRVKKTKPWQFPRLRSTNLCCTPSNRCSLPSFPFLGLLFAFLASLLNRYCNKLQCDCLAKHSWYSCHLGQHYVIKYFWVSCDSHP